MYSLTERKEDHSYVRKGQITLWLMFLIVTHSHYAYGHLTVEGTVKTVYNPIIFKKISVHVAHVHIFPQVHLET
jgi:hypothetical protein